MRVTGDEVACRAKAAFELKTAAANLRHAAMEARAEDLSISLRIDQEAQKREDEAEMTELLASS